MGESGDQAIFAAVLALRLLVPLAITRVPLPAILASLALDAVDQTVFQTFTDLELTGYQGYDKALDVYYLGIAYLSTIRGWTNRSAFEVGRALLYYRLVGVMLFEITDERVLLLVFPNTFEYFFIFYELFRLRWNPNRMSTGTVVGAAAAIWVVIKLPQEYWIHIAQLDVTDTLRSAPLLCAILAGLITLVVVAGWPAVRRRLPPPDHRPSSDVEGDVVAVPSRRAGRRAWALLRLIDWTLVEKTVLVSLTIIIFSQMLPNSEASPLEIAVGVGLVILGNTAVSEWLLRRGVGWETALRQFIAMAAINVGLVEVSRLVLPGGDSPTTIDITLFFLLLLTLLITLYDRFRPYQLAREAGQST